MHATDCPLSAPYFEGQCTCAEPRREPRQWDSADISYDEEPA